MSIYHMSAKVISRNSGRSSVAAAAYRSGETLVDERQGLTHDYTKKKGVEHTEIMLPGNAPAKYADRQTLWNAVEKAEKDSKAQLAREIEVALPLEFGRQIQLYVLHQYVQENFVNQGMIADIALHDKDDGNPHAHIMLTMRPMDENGKWEQKNEKIYLCKNTAGQEQGFTAKELRQTIPGEWEKQLPYFKNGKGRPIYLTKREAEMESKYKDYIRVKGKKNPKIIKEPRVNPTLRQWNDSNNVEKWREQWAYLCNRVFEQEKIQKNIDHRSYARQGKEQLPTMHLGTNAAAMERRGYQTERGKYNEEVKALNREIKKLEQSIYLLEKESNLERPIERERPVVGGNLVATLNNLKGTYIKLELQIENSRQLVANIDKQAGEIRFKLRDINEQIQKIDAADTRIIEQKDKRAALGLFHGKEKKAIDETVSRFEQTKAYSLDMLKRKYGITPSNVKEILKELRENLALIYKQRKDIADTTHIRDNQKKIEQEYRKVSEAIMRNPEAKQNTEEYKMPQTSSKTKSYNERMVEARVESRLKNISRETTRKERVIEHER